MGPIYKPGEQWGQALAPRRDNRYFNVRTETGRWRDVYDLNEFPPEAGAYGDNEILWSWVEDVGSGCDLHSEREIDAAIAGWSILTRGKPYTPRRTRDLRNAMIRGTQSFAPFINVEYGIPHTCASSLWHRLGELPRRAPGGGRHLKASGR